MNNKKILLPVFILVALVQLYVPAEIAADIISISESFGVAAQIVGRVEKSDKTELTIQTPHGVFKY